MSTARVLAVAAAFLLWVSATSSVLRTLIVPRGISSYLAIAVRRAVRWPFSQIAWMFERYERRDALLVWIAPLQLLVLLVTWLALYFVAYAFAAYAGGTGLANGFIEAGSSMFTLGFAAPTDSQADAVDFLAAATGPIVIALQIAYLPTLYAAYNRREVDVTLLQSRAGEPAWGPEILARHKTIDILDTLPDFYAGWERWAADVSESHVNYPMLISFRSPRPWRSWLVGLIAVLDSAALYLALSPTRAPSEARLCLRMGFTCLRDLADVMRIPYNADPSPDEEIQLPYDEFLQAVHHLERVDFPVERTPEEAWPHFRGWRVNYESIAYVLASRLESVPALWTGPRHRLRSLMAPSRPAHREPTSAGRSR